MKRTLFLFLFFLIGCSTPAVKNSGVVPGSGSVGAQYYFLAGEVKKPGEYKLPEEGTLDAYQAIMRGGGVIRLRADQNKTVIVRSVSKNKKQILKIQDITEKGEIATNQNIQAGDIIYVPPHIFAVIGDVVSVLLSPIKGLLELSTVAVAASA